MLVIQARLNSLRWPRKVLANIEGTPMIDRMWKQCNASDIKPVIVAVPAADDELVDHCRERGYLVYPYKGDRNDLIGRYYRALLEYGSERCLRITADCAYHMPQEMAWVWHHGQMDDFISNGWPDGRTTPDGVDCEVYSRRLLKWMHENVTDAKHREHLPLYIYENFDSLKTRFFLKRLDWPVNMSKVKTSIDSTDDVVRMKNEGLI